MKKIFWPGILAGLATLILSLAVSYLFMVFPAVAQDYANPSLMRAWTDPLMALFFIYPFILGIILAWAWDRSKGLFSGSASVRGYKFGWAVFLITTLPGMIISYSSFPISLLTTISWALGGFLSLIASGLIFARLNKA